MPIAHQESDEAFIALIHFFLSDCEGNPGRIDYGKVIGHRVVETYESMLEEPELLRLISGSDHFVSHCGSKGSVIGGPSNLAPASRTLTVAWLTGMTARRYAPDAST
ncbi:MAG TPA: hypothetical protein VJ837_01255 [Candidatus Paceibacterota bacterium]|nr:hypothetical protein [Candidatus Paceibacterota bacterium]